MSKYQAYPEYKDSGVEWLGEMPSHWRVIPIKHLADLNPKKSAIDHTLLNKECNFLPMEKLKLNSIVLDEKRLVSDVYDGYTYFEDGDVLMAKVTPCFENKNIAVACGLVNGVGFGSSEIYVLRSNEKTDNRFLYYRLQEDSFMDIATAAMTGAGGLKRVPSDVVNGYSLGTPEADEQTKIASFLDHETAKIDTLIDKQQQLIKLLKEKRQAVISHAVTKGLNPEAPMKGSGVEWLGKVPEHWDLVPLKYLCLFSGGGTPSKDNLAYWTNGTMPWVSPKDMKTFWVDKTQDYITDIAVKESSTNLVETGALLMVVRSGILQRTIPIAINTIPVTLNQDMKALRFNERMTAIYAANYIVGNVDKLLLEWSKEGATVESIEHEYLTNSLFPVPPVEEQQQIVDVLKVQMDRYDQLEQRSVKGIELLSERRTALISAAVTGKIDVRNWQVPVNQETQQEAG
ncbi:restriction endonuclease subunit S [Vibrio gallaecicus]|uniref:restriction endonuclease subunit S n=1 Tax=Vibrio gallaecicus TaxID=552386 RepID=UPI0010C9D404|nr:restriction endonuclease subunit S [Vibrio gallaecicus]MDN3614895.1 restriction endonuclease subunit S [Vibrio gallaecicus]